MNIENLNLLLVEDNKQLRDIMAELLESEFKNIFCAEDGVEALKVYNEQQVDLIITDLQMPKMDGLELISLIRSQNANIPIFLITALTNEDYSSYIENLKINAFMNKPVDIKALYSHIELAVS